MRHADDPTRTERGRHQLVAMTESLTELRESLSGDVLTASDREYERARLSFNLLIDRRPAAIARC